MGVSRIVTGTGIVLVSLLIVASFSVYLAPHFGWQVNGLRSGSMAPQLNIGDMVVTRPAAPETVAIGDVIIFHSIDKKNILISHRVIGIQRNSPLSFTTRGDANESPDPFTVPAGNLVGKLAFHIPLLGYAILFLQTKSGLLVSLVFPGVLLLALCLRSLRNELAGRRGQGIRS